MCTQSRRPYRHSSRPTALNRLAWWARCRTRRTCRCTTEWNHCKLPSAGSPSTSKRWGRICMCRWCRCRGQRCTRRCPRRRTRREPASHRQQAGGAAWRAVPPGLATGTEVAASSGQAQKLPPFRCCCRTRLYPNSLFAASLAGRPTAGSQSPVQHTASSPPTRLSTSRATPHPPLARFVSTPPLRCVPPLRSPCAAPAAASSPLPAPRPQRRWAAAATATALRQGWLQQGRRVW